MNILLLGSGAREHAFAYSLAKSPRVRKIYACPGNAGMEKISICERIPEDRLENFLKTAKSRVNLVIPGSSNYAESGFMDKLLQEGIPVIGPAGTAGKIETSKAFAFDFMTRYGIKTPKTAIVFTPEEAEAAIDSHPSMTVVKCDGLAHGKGVSVYETSQDAKIKALDLLKNKKPPVIIQEKIKGTESSYIILTDGEQWISFSSCRDYKRAGEMDTGATTGGMGALSPSPDLTSELEQKIVSEIVTPLIEGLRKDNLAFRGFLSIQLMLSGNDIYVLEFNARFGDPEAQAVLSRFRGDLAALLKDCSEGRLTSAGSEVAFGKHSATAVVLARKGYPESENAIPVIMGEDKLENSRVYYSSCSFSEDRKGYDFKTGRLLTVTAVGLTPEEATEACYKDIGRLTLQNVFYRRDIGKKALPSGD